MKGKKKETIASKKAQQIKKQGQSNKEIKEKESEKGIESMKSVEDKKQQTKPLDAPKRSLPKEQNMTIRPYLQKSFQTVINEGLKQVLKNRPEDPINYLGQYLLAQCKDK